MSTRTAGERLATDGTTHDVAVIVCTRDRPEQLENTLRTVLDSDYREFELLVVDQSSTDRSSDLVTRIADRDARLRLRRDAGTGLSRARNIGISSTSSQFIVFTDDDCEPAPNWLGLMTQALREDPSVGAVFGSVIPVQCDPAYGFIVGYVPPRRQRLVGRLAKLRDGGIGANMGFRRSALRAAGPFDEMLGAGGYFPSCEDGDMTYRTLRAGYAVAHLPDAEVNHFGLRDWKSGSRLTYLTYVAVAAAFMKFIRLHDVVGVLLLLHALLLSLTEIASSVRQNRRPFGFGRTLGLLIGMCRSFELPVDQARSIYRSRGSSRST